MGTQIDYKVVFALQEQILKSEHLSAEQKIAMLLEAIKNAREKEKQ